MYQYLLKKAILITNPANYYAPSYDTTIQQFDNKQKCKDKLLWHKENFNKAVADNVSLIQDIDQHKSDVLIYKLPNEGRIIYYTCLKSNIRRAK